MSEAYQQLCSFENVLAAIRQAAKGKRGGSGVARFEFRCADELIGLQQELADFSYRPGPYAHFHIHEPKRRKISAAPFRDRIVHHALCHIIEPRFESCFIPDSFANRVGRGTHRAVDRLQELAGGHAYVLRAYLRYVDDFALFSDSKQELWRWKRAIIERLSQLRLTIHENAAQVLPIGCGIPWLGFVVWPDHRKLKARKAREATRRLGQRYEDYRNGKISFGELDASVKGWVNHVRYADTWGLRQHVFDHLAKSPEGEA